jgi:ubiquitin-small subunit ribosomal protein S27Ae
MTKKPKPKNKIPSKKYSKYSESDNKVQRKQTCPKCGAGVFLAIHKDRKHCGKCSYTIFEEK